MTGEHHFFLCLPDLCFDFNDVRFPDEEMNHATDGFKKFRFDDASCGSKEGEAAGVVFKKDVESEYFVMNKIDTRNTDKSWMVAAFNRSID